MGDVLLTGEVADTPRGDERERFDEKQDVFVDCPGPGFIWCIVLLVLKSKHQLKSEPMAWKFITMETKGTTLWFATDGKPIYTWL